MGLARIFLALSLGIVLASGVRAQEEGAAPVEETEVAEGTGSEELVPGAAPIGGCFVEPADLSDDEVAAFLAGPAQILAAYPDDGLALALQVRGLAGSDASTILPLVQLSRGANPTEINSIAAGLAQAAEACVATRPDIAEYIQLLIATSGSETLLVAFAAASEDLSVAALPGQGDLPSAPVIAASAIGDTEDGPSEGGSGSASGGGDGSFGGGGGGGGGFTSGGGGAGDVSPTSP